jgi:hypothetical protein
LLSCNRLQRTAGHRALGKDIFRLRFLALVAPFILVYESVQPASAVPLVQPTAAAEARGPSLALLEPASGAYFGVNLSWDEDSAAAFNERVGKPAAVYVQFVRFPFGTEEISYLADFVDQVASQHGMALLTLEPFGGLDAVTAEAVADLAERLAVINSRGVPVLLRFAHEMNGSWYPWGQRPEEYVATFQALAAVVHERAPLTAMLWAPNHGSGYPFAGGKFAAPPRSREFIVLDTNADGALDMRDDPYAPYYPGDSAVDWVGMSLYHWGYEYPWGENSVPEPTKFLAQLTGSYATPHSDERTLPNFYRTYAESHGKPMAIPETAAFYRPDGRGAEERAIKLSWLEQVFGGRLQQQLPRIKLVNWFEWSKFESEVGAVVDWRMTEDPEITRAAHDLLSTPYWLSPQDPETSGAKGLRKSSQS